MSCTVHFCIFKQSSLQMCGIQILGILKDFQSFQLRFIFFFCQKPTDSRFAILRNINKLCSRPRELPECFNSVIPNSTESTSLLSSFFANCRDLGTVFVFFSNLNKILFFSNVGFYNICKFQPFFLNIYPNFLIQFF